MCLCLLKSFTSLSFSTMKFNIPDFAVWLQHFENFSFWMNNIQQRGEGGGKKVYSKALLGAACWDLFDQLT